MGRTLLILLSGFAISFGVLSVGKNNRLLDSTDRAIDNSARYSSKNAATSGAYMALNQLYLNPGWRTGYNNLSLSGNLVDVVVEDASDDASIGNFRVRIQSTGSNPDTSSLSEVVVFDRKFNTFAVWAKDTVMSTTAKDSLGNVNPDLIISKAPFMPKLDKQGLYDEATDQGHVMNEDINSHFHPDNHASYLLGGEFLNGNFYYDSSGVSVVPNVIRVMGDLHLRDNITIHGIYIVEGDVLLNENAHLKGIIYMPNPGSRVYNRENFESNVTGGIVTWGDVDGEGFAINVQHKPEYWRAFIKDYVTDNPPMRVISWK